MHFNYCSNTIYFINGKLDSLQSNHNQISCNYNHLDLLHLGYSGNNDFIRSLVNLINQLLLLFKLIKSKS